MSEVVVALLLIVCIAALSTGGLVFVRRKIGFAALIEHHEVANPMMSIVATFYSVLLGFLVVCAFNRFDSCRVLVQGEANSMSDVFHLAMGLHPGERLKIQNDCLNYVQSVIVDEFPAMQAGHASPVTRTKIDIIWNDLLTLTPKDELQGNVHQQMLTALMAASEHRRDRLFAMSVGNVAGTLGRFDLWECHSNRLHLFLCNEAFEIATDHGRHAVLHVIYQHLSGHRF